jgi:hypothetical protein
MAGELGIPARVVMGFYPGEDAVSTSTFAATGDDLHAWVEVPFTGVGWVRFDPTPPKDHVPTDQATKPRSQPKPQVLQPPPPAQQPADEPPTVPADHGKKDDKNPAAGILLAILGAIGIGAGVVAVVAFPFVLIGALKTNRRRRRIGAERPADRISGGWDELRDRALDYGTPLRPGALRSEDAATMSATLAAPAVGVLAQHADAQVWGPAEPSDEDVAAFWGHVDGIVGEIDRSHGFWRRLRARINIRSLLAGTPLERWLPRPRAAVRKKTDASAPRETEPTERPTGAATAGRTYAPAGREEHR